MNYGRPVWAEIDLSAIRHNMHAIRSLTRPETKFCAVIKADGYGHGAIPMAVEAVKSGADYLAVAILDEAIALRQAGFTLPILILGYTPANQAAQVAAYNFTQTIYTGEQAVALAAAGREAGCMVPVHIKLDTGMGRLGIAPRDAAAFAETVVALQGLKLEGVFTHFASADSRDKSYTRKQFAAFSKALDAMKARGIHIPICHCANSAATLDLPEMHLDMIRPGIILYGLWPSEETTHPIELRPAMSLKARIAMLKDVPPGTCLSYGCTHVTTAKARIATLPLGYADGWSRSLSGKAEILAYGQRAPLVGRICMDQCLADVTSIPSLHEGDEVTLFGPEALSADSVAALLGTINYEVTCMIGKRVPRVYR